LDENLTAETRNARTSGKKGKSLMLKSEGLLRRKSSLEPAVSKIAYAIMLQAINDIHYGGKSKRVSKWKADAAEWFESEEDDVGSFVWVCRILGWDPGRTRTAVISVPIRKQRSKPAH